MRTPDELAPERTRLFELLTGPGRTMTTARMVLLVEASHDERLLHRWQRYARGWSA